MSHRFFSGRGSFELAQTLSRVVLAWHFAWNSTPKDPRVNNTRRPQAPRVRLFCGSARRTAIKQHESVNSPPGVGRGGFTAREAGSPRRLSAPPPPKACVSLGLQPRKNSRIHIDVSHSRQPLVKGERLVRYEVNTVKPYPDDPCRPHCDDNLGGYRRGTPSPEAATTSTDEFAVSSAPWARRLTNCCR